MNKPGFIGFSLFLVLGCPGFASGARDRAGYRFDRASSTSIFDGSASGRGWPVVESVQEGTTHMRIGLLFLLTPATPPRIDGKSTGSESSDSQNVAMWSVIAILLVTSSFYRLTQLIKNRPQDKEKI